MDKEQKEIELRKLEIEKAKVLEGILRTLFFVLVADIGGTLTLILNFHKYNKGISFILIGLSLFIGIGIIFAIGMIIAEIRYIKDRAEI